MVGLFELLYLVENFLDGLDFSLFSFLFADDGQVEVEYLRRDLADVDELALLRPAFEKGMSLRFHIIEVDPSFFSFFTFFLEIGNFS